MCDFSMMKLNRKGSPRMLSSSIRASSVGIRAGKGQAFDVEIDVNFIAHVFDQPDRPRRLSNDGILIAAQGSAFRRCDVFGTDTETNLLADVAGGDFAANFPPSGIKTTDFLTSKTARIFLKARAVLGLS